MASFNYSTMQMTVKVVYYGPGLCGKTTNLQYIYDHTTKRSRGEMVSLETQTDRTLFFDLLPLEVGTIAGFNTRIQLYTVPGQVFYNTTRKLVLKGVDGVVFVADSQRAMAPANRESLSNLEANLAELGILIGSIPLVFQYNKRDLADITPVDEMESRLNRSGAPAIEASAIDGRGVFETLRAISRQTLLALKKQLEDGISRAGRQPAVAAATAPAAAPAPPAASPAVATTSDNGGRSPRRSLLLNLRRADFERARRLFVNLRVEDGDQQIVHEVRNVRVELEPPPTPQEELLQLRIQLRSEE